MTGSASVVRLDLRWATPFRLAHVLDAYTYLLADNATPPDQSLQKYCRARRYLGSQDRRFIGDAVFDLLRHRLRGELLWQAWNRTQQISQDASGKPTLAAWYLWLYEQLGSAAVDAAARAWADVRSAQTRRAKERPLPLSLPEQMDDFVAWVAAGAPGIDPELGRAARLSLPVALVRRWDAAFGSAETEQAARAFAAPAFVDLRVNVRTTTVQQCRDALDAAGIAHERAPLVPHGLRLLRRANLAATPLLRNGWAEVQDAGSQLVSLALAPQPGWRVLDACAGAGGKTLHLAALLGDDGLVLAHDTDPTRMAPLRQRVRRAGYRSVLLVQPIRPGAGALHPLGNRAEWAGFGPSALALPVDAVLIDAPCTGLGTLRRSPYLAWQNGDDAAVARFAQMQLACLERYAPLVRPNGVVVYATCSIEPAECEEVIARFLALNNDFLPDPVGPALRASGAGQAAADAEGHCLRLWPHRHATDGFFIARLRRRGRRT